MNKRVIIVLLSLIICSIIVYFTVFHSLIFNANNGNIAEYQKYLQNDVYGTDIITIINKAVDQNEYNGVEKDEDLKYISNEKNSLKIDIKFTEKEEVVPMESIYNAGIESFIKFYSNKKFKCVETKLHKNTNNISYIKFEER